MRARRLHRTRTCEDMRPTHTRTQRSTQKAVRPNRTGLPIMHRAACHPRTIFQHRRSTNIVHFSFADAPSVDVDDVAVHGHGVYSHVNAPRSREAHASLRMQISCVHIHNDARYAVYASWKANQRAGDLNCVEVSLFSIGGTYE